MGFEKAPRDARRSSPPVTLSMAVQIVRLVDAGHMQHDVAARFGINQGRVSEVINGHLFPMARAMARSGIH